LALAALLSTRLLAQSAPANGIPLSNPGPGLNSPPPASPLNPMPGAAPGMMPAAAPAQGGPAAPDIHDIHGLVPLTYWERYGTETIVGGVAAVLVLSLLVWLLLHKKVRPPLTPIERARQELAAARALLATGQDQAFAITVSGAVRHYLENAYHMPAPERTTEEFLQEASRHDWLRGELTTLLRRFLELCDLAKFAGQQYGPAEREQLHAAASEFVETADRLLHPPKPKDEKNRADGGEEPDGPPKPTAQDLAKSLAKVSPSPS
jgi:hypothetical protein